MKVAKIKQKQKKEIINSEEVYSLKRMIKIVIALLAIFCFFYFITILLVDNKKSDENNSVSVIDSSKIILSQLLTRNEEEYYVIATQSSLYDSSYIETSYIKFYNNYINTYSQKEDSLKFYYVDLDSALNKNYLGEDINITNDIEKLKLNNEVLFKIKKGKIEKYYVGKEQILDKLSSL